MTNDCYKKKISTTYAKHVYVFFQFFPQFLISASPYNGFHVGKAGRRSSEGIQSSEIQFGIADSPPYKRCKISQYHYMIIPIMPFSNSAVWLTLTLDNSVCVSDISCVICDNYVIL